MNTRSSAETRVIIVAPSGRDALLTEQILTESDIEAFRCDSIEHLFFEFEIGAGAVLLASEVLNQQIIAKLSHVLERQPAWSDLSIIIVTGAGTGSSRASQLRELSVLTNATILERPVRAATIVNSVRIALRARARQYVMRDHLVERTRLEMQLADAYHKQHRIAETLQSSILNHPAKEAFPGLKLATLYVAAKEEAEVGGDFFDVFAAGEDKVVVVVGDVSGKGLDAAARSLEVKYPLRAFLRIDANPSSAINLLNDYLINSQNFDHPNDIGFICICICVINTEDRSLNWSSAAFEGPLIAADNDLFELLESHGPPLGVIANQKYTDTFRSLNDGETIVLFTDGVTEARKGAQFFGVEGVIDCFKSTQTDVLSEVVHQVAQCASRFSDDANGDDVCIVAVKLV